MIGQLQANLRELSRQLDQMARLADYYYWQDQNDDFTQTVQTMRQLAALIDQIRTDIRRLQEVEERKEFDNMMEQVAERIVQERNDIIFHYSVREIGTPGPDFFCGICQNTQQGLPGCITRCNHEFHTECITRWMRGGPDRRCPNCRGTL